VAVGAALALAAGLAAGCGGKKAAACPTGETSCSGQCKDLQVDLANCGLCGLQCPAGGTCTAGICACPASTDLCLGACVDLAADEGNCGTCGHDCGLGTCAAGTCACAAGSTDCGGSPQCVNLATSIQHCGSCTNPCTPANGSCVGGSCICAAPHPDFCPPPANLCTDLASDLQNCGACGSACTRVNGACVGRSCICAAPRPDFCPVANLCTSLASDAQNCGSCGHACPAGQTCSGGTCSCTVGAACGPACCPVGSACSCPGTTCQTKHDNGLGQFFYDCKPLDTFTLESAQAAALAWNAAGSPTVPPCSNCFAWQTSNQCATWCYAGSVPGFVGKVTVNTDMNAPLCPPGPGPVTSWH
jgi:hypothetical protein